MAAKQNGTGGRGQGTGSGALRPTPSTLHPDNAARDLGNALERDRALAEAIFSGFTAADLKQMRDAVRRMATGTWKIVAVPKKGARTMHEFGIPVRDVMIDGALYEEMYLLWIEPSAKMLELIAAYNVGRPSQRKEKEDREFVFKYAVPGFDDDEVIEAAQAEAKAALEVAKDDDIGFVLR